MSEQQEKHLLNAYRLSSKRNQELLFHIDRLQHSFLQFEKSVNLLYLKSEPDFRQLQLFQQISQLKTYLSQSKESFQSDVSEVEQLSQAQHQLLSANEQLQIKSKQLEQEAYESKQRLEKETLAQKQVIQSLEEQLAQQHLQQQHLEKKIDLEREKHMQLNVRLQAELQKTQKTLQEQILINQELKNKPFENRDWMKQISVSADESDFLLSAKTMHAQQSLEISALKREIQFLRRFSGSGSVDSEKYQILETQYNHLVKIHNNLKSWWVKAMTTGIPTPQDVPLQLPADLKPILSEESGKLEPVSADSPQGWWTEPTVTQIVNINDCPEAIQNHIQLIDLYNRSLLRLGKLLIENQQLKQQHIQTEPQIEISQLIEERDAWKENTRRLELEIWELRHEKTQQPPTQDNQSSVYETEVNHDQPMPPCPQCHDSQTYFI